MVEASSLIDTINNTGANFGGALLSGLNQIKNSSTAGTNLITKAQTGVGSSYIDTYNSSQSQYVFYVKNNAGSGSTKTYTGQIQVTRIC